MKKNLLAAICLVLSFTRSIAQTPVTINFRYAARIAMRAVVSVRSELVTGSGVVIADSGLVITNFHVVSGARQIEVIFGDGRSFPATLAGLDQRTDLALLNVDARGLAFLHFAPAGSIAVGDVVLAIGHPFGLPATATMGIISATARTTNWRSGGNAADAFLQTDAVVNPGNSGGALVDVHGRLVGITAAIATPTGTFAGYSFAIPAEIVQPTIRDLLRYGKVLHGDLGVAVSNMDPEQAHRLGFSRPTGLHVDSLNPAGPAAEAGLRPGDVITRIDDYAVETPARLYELIARHKAGERISLHYARDGNIYRCYPRLKLESPSARQDQ
jgi:S1-C subfamily serine protease